MSNHSRLNFPMQPKFSIILEYEHDFVSFTSTSVRFVKLTA